jgi:hypothetical protein
MASTSNYGWETPDDTDYVYQGASAARTTANSIDTTLAGLAQKYVSYTTNTAGTLNVTSGANTELFQSPSFTAKTNRLYLVSYTVGSITKLTTADEIIVTMRFNSAAGAPIDTSYYEPVAAGYRFTHNKTFPFTIGSAPDFSFVPAVCIQGGTGGYSANNTSGVSGYVIITDIGSI